MLGHDIKVGDKIQDMTTGRDFTVVRIPTSRKRSYGVIEAGAEREKFVYKSELWRFQKI